MKQNMKNAIGLSLKRYNETYMKATNDRIDNIVSQAGTDNTEIVDARIDSAGVTHTTLNNRIIAETKMNDQHLVSCSGEHITAENTMGGSITNLEVLGNTIQNEEDLADIKSVGVLQEDGTYKMSILSCGKNLINVNDIVVNEGVSTSTGNFGVDATRSRTSYIKFNPNVNYVATNVEVVFFYDKNKQFISFDRTLSGVSPSNCNYIVVRMLNETTNWQLEEGTVATPYEPYQGNKCDILLPCQLEKVGDVSDRLYYDDVEKAWCIEKNIGNVVLNGSERTGVFNTNATLTNYIQNIHPGMKLVNNTPIILSTFKNENYSSSKDYEYGYSWVINGESCIYLNFLKSKGNTDSEFKTWLSQNPTLVKYQLATPQKIVLPLSTQITLNSFFGTTHIYMESGEVEGTIKCKIPKSLGATVQSLNNKTDILSDRIEAIEGLKDSQNMKYETDKGYLVCKETKNGVIDDLKIEGKTLVNLASTVQWGTYNGAVLNEVGVDNVTFTTVGYAKVAKVFNLVPNTDYIVTFIKSSGVSSYYRHTDNPNTSNAIVLKDGATITTSDTGILNLSFEGEALTNATVTELMVVKATEYRKNQAYFEGLKSVGQDVDKIEVLSVNENLVPSDWDYKFQCFGDMKVNQIDIRTFEIVNTNTVDGIVISKNFINKFCYNNKVVFDFYSNQRGVFYVLDYGVSGEGYKPVQGAMVIEGGRNVFVVDVSNASGRLAFRFNNNTKNSTMIISDFSIKTSKNSNNVNHQSDKKQILFYNSNGELEPIQELHEGDSIEKHSDNKWYYHKRSGKVVLNGSEFWELRPQSDSQDVIAFNGSGLTTSSNALGVVCDKFPTIEAFGEGANFENVFIATSTRMQIRVLKSKLSTQDVQGFKQWLQANNVTVVYQLAQEEVYEIVPLHLDSYANETLILCNSGAISPRMEFSITSHINELVKAYGERINLLEEKVYQYMVTQNRMQLASTYSADSVTFKVDYFSLCGDEENYDEDLYNLILNNILVGKDNYNYDKMFTIILDYASWNQISWEQFDILVGLMDVQHNPPVEELPTEDEVIEETPNEIM